MHLKRRRTFFLFSLSSAKMIQDQAILTSFYTCHQNQNICDVLHDLVPFVQFKKREKHPWWSVTFVASLSVLTKSNTHP